MDIYEKARELGQMISDSEELTALRAAEQIIMNDKYAMDLLNNFGNIREEYAQALSNGEANDKLEEMKQNIVAKNQELLTNAVAKNYIESKGKVDNIFKTVSDILLRAVNGEQIEEESGCSSGGCSCCGGGCS